MGSKGHARIVIRVKNLLSSIEHSAARLTDLVPTGLEQQDVLTHPVSGLGPKRT